MGEASGQPWYGTGVGEATAQPWHEDATDGASSHWEAAFRSSGAAACGGFVAPVPMEAALSTSTSALGSSAVPVSLADAAPMLTGVAGMEMINDMFQRQARRVESQLQQQVNDCKKIDFSNAQLLVMQSQLMWHAKHYQERADQVNQSSETITRMQMYIEQMAAEQARSVEVAQQLSSDVATMRRRMLASQPQNLEDMQGSLSELGQGATDLAHLPHIGELFALREGLPSLVLHSQSSSATSRHSEDNCDKSDHNSHDSSCSDSADASAASTIAKRHARRHAGPSHAVQRAHAAAAQTATSSSDGESPPFTPVDAAVDAAGAAAAAAAAASASETGTHVSGARRDGRYDGRHGGRAGAAMGSEPLGSFVQGVLTPGTVALQPLVPGTPLAIPRGVGGGAGGHAPIGQVGIEHRWAGLNSATAAAALPHLLSSTTTADMQGVLPYPGQGLLGVQQGVIAGNEALEPFLAQHGATPEPFLAPALVAALAPAQLPLRPPPPMSGEPPPKRLAAAELLMASAMAPSAMAPSAMAPAAMAPAHDAPPSLKAPFVVTQGVMTQGMVQAGRGRAALRAPSPTARSPAAWTSR